MSLQSFSLLLASALCISHHSADAFVSSSTTATLSLSSRQCRTDADAPSSSFSSQLHMASWDQLDDSNMKDLLFAPPEGKAVLVDACTQWCGPCKLIEPYLEASSKKHSDKLSVIKYDVEGDNNKNLKVEMLLQGVMVRALPTLIFYSNGSPLATHSGAITESGLEEWLAEGFAKMEGFELESEVAKQSATVATASSIMKEEEQQPPKRGFISFGAQVDDYALGM